MVINHFQGCSNSLSIEYESLIAGKEKHLEMEFEEVDKEVTRPNHKVTRSNNYKNATFDRS